MGRQWGSADPIARHRPPPMVCQCHMLRTPGSRGSKRVVHVDLQSAMLAPHVIGIGGGPRFHVSPAWEVRGR